MRKLSMIIAVALLACACKQELFIVHTNDTHSHLDPERSGAFAGRGGVIERAACIDSVRSASGRRNVLLLHAGDFNQGTSYYSELGGELEVDLVNALGYDCITLGNHEFDNGIEDLAARVARIECPVVCANLDLSPFELGQYVKPCTVVRKAGRRIGIIGLVSDLSKLVLATVSSRIPQLDAVECTNRWARYLREEKKCDMVILLSHLGYSEDQALVPQVRGIDLVIGGHSHTFVEDFIYVNDLDGRSIPIVTDGCFGYQLGLITVK